MLPAALRLPQHLEVEGFGEQLDEHGQADALREPRHGRRAEQLGQAQTPHHVGENGQRIEPDKQARHRNQKPQLGQRLAQAPQQQRANAHRQRIEAQ